MIGHHLPFGFLTEQDQKDPYTPCRSFIGLSCTGQRGATAASAVCGVSILLGSTGKVFGVRLDDTRLLPHLRFVAVASTILS